MKRKYTWRADDICFTPPQPRKDYSPDQPRASNGQFGEGGGGGLEEWRNRAFARLSTEQQQAESLWSSGAYKSINHLVRAAAKDPSVPLAARPEIAQLDAAIAQSKTPTDMVVWRGCKQEVFTGVKEGAVFSDTGFVATSPDKKVAGQFAQWAGEDHDDGGALVTIHVPKDHPALPIHGQNDDEHEVLLPRASKFKIISIKQGDESKPSLVEAQLL